MASFEAQKGCRRDCRYLTNESQMIERSNEVIKQLNRLANDRSLAPQTRNKLREAVQHIKDLQIRITELKRESELVAD